MEDVVQLGLRPHQRSARQQMIEGKRALFHPYGTGKSSTTLDFMSSHLGTSRLCILCKKQNVRTWTLEINKWLPELTVYPITGARAGFAALYEKVIADDPQRFAIILPYPSYAGAPELHREYLKKLNVVTFAADESTIIKNPKAAITQEALLLSRAFPNSERLVLSGNPKPEGEYEVWSQFQFTGHNPFTEHTYYNWLRNWFVKPQYGPYVLKIDRHEEFRKRLEAGGIWMSEEDLQKFYRENGIPQSQYIMEHYEFMPIQKKMLQHLYQNWCLPDENDVQFEMNYMISLQQKAQQICSGFYYTPSEEAVELMPLECNPKMKALNALIELLLDERPERKILIWRKYAYEDYMLEMNWQLNKYAKDFYALTGVDSIAQFYSDPAAKVLHMPVDLSEGFNELVIADVGIFVSNTFSQEKRTQAEKRIERDGQKSPYCLQIDLVSPDERDMEVVMALQAKDLTSAKLKTITNKYFDRKEL